MNKRNYYQKTNWLGGSDKFEELPFYLTNVNIPGINFNLPEVGGRSSTKFSLASDTIEYNDLSFDMIIDEDFLIYQEFLDKINNSISVKNASFSDQTFDFWIQLNNNKSNKTIKFYFYNCRIQSIGDIDLSTQDADINTTMNVTIKFDHFNIDKTEIPQYLIPS